METAFVETEFVETYSVETKFVETKFGETKFGETKFVETRFYRLEFNAHVEHGWSASGLSAVVASTHGFVMVAGTNIVMSLSAHKRRYDAMHLRSSPAKVRARLGPSARQYTIARKPMDCQKKRMGTWHS